VDHMSGGRVDIGLGAGWYEAEHQAFGLPFPPLATRYDLLEDALAILDGVWTAQPGATFEMQGRTASVRIAADTVRPLQQPRPPIVLGGAGGPRSARLAARYADEYNVSFQSSDATLVVHDRVRAVCDKSGRDPSSIVWSAGQVLCCGKTEADVARRAAAIGR